MRLFPRDPELGWTPLAWLIYLVPFTATPLISSRFAGPSGWFLFGGATLFFFVIYCRSYWARGRELVLIACATTAMGIAFWPIAYGAGAFFIYAASMLGQLHSSRAAFRGVLAVVLVSIVEGVFLQRGLLHGAWPPIFALLIGSINIHFFQVGRANARLRLARDEIEHLAKTAERERIARDLHDLLGHTLSVVILKSELAAKLAERDPERARTEIRDVERISRDALAQVRAAVTGYRSGGLAGELMLARTALQSAGVSLECDLPARPLPSAHEAVLALALREAVTNVVRHAGARHCRVALIEEDSALVLTVSDDGRGGAQSSGSGLQGMRERVEGLGGTLQRDGRSGTTLVVRLPLGTAEVRSA